MYSLVLFFTVYPLIFLAPGSSQLSFGPFLSLIIASDCWSFFFLCLLVLNTAAVLLWSYYYMDSCLEYRNFLSCLLTFLFSIVLVVLAGNLTLFFIGWDLLGFSSLWLVVYYRSRSSLLGGLLVGLTNRVGDVFFFLSISACFFFQSLSPYIIFFVMVTSITKSALLPFSAWLPLAMSAPTPVSALVHSSTLVTAGLWLLIRLNFLLTPLFSYLGLLTLLVGALGSLCSVDLKNIVALSTLSHLGLMFAFLGLGSSSICFLHLICHGIVKANLFLCVGTVIHSNYGSQEIRACGGLSSSHPFTMVALVVSALSLSGLFFITCYESKHLLVLSLLNTYTSLIFGLLLHAGLVFSVAYSWRLVLVVLCPTTLPSPLVGGSTSIVKLPIGLLTTASTLAGPALSNSLVLETSVSRPAGSLVPLLVILLGFFLGFLVWTASQGVGTDPFSILSMVSYATLWSVCLGGPIKATETGPLSPLFYKGLLKAGTYSRGVSAFTFQNLFSTGLILAALLAL